MKYRVCLKRTRTDYAMVDVEAKSSAEAKQKVMALSREPHYTGDKEMFCDEDDPKVSVSWLSSY